MTTTHKPLYCGPGVGRRGPFVRPVYPGYGVPYGPRVGTCPGAYVGPV